MEDFALSEALPSSLAEALSRAIGDALTRAGADGKDADGVNYLHTIVQNRKSMRRLREALEELVAPEVSAAVVRDL